MKEMRPTLRIDDMAVERRNRDDASVGAAYDATRSSLLERIRDVDDQTGWQRFFDTYWKLIYSTALRAGLTDAEAQDAVQETVLAVARQMPAFVYDRGKGSFKGWLLTTTRWKIVEQFRKRPRREVRLAAEEAEGEPDPLDNLPGEATGELDRIWDEEWRLAMLDTAVRRVRNNVAPKQFQIFDLHVLKGEPVKHVCLALGITAAQVYLARHRVGKLVRRELRAVEEESL